MPFITYDISIRDFEYDNFNRYDFTLIKDRDGFLDDIMQKGWTDEYNTVAQLSFKEILIQYSDEYYEYLEARFAERYEIPMMISLYYFPWFIDFSEEDRYRVSPSTTLLYDNHKEMWAVGMTGGGLDLSPHLLDTFINLSSGIPMNIALAIRKGYCAYMDKEKHLNNCKKLAQAFLDESQRNKNYARQLQTVKLELK